MGRLSQDTIQRIEAFVDRVVSVWRVVRRDASLGPIASQLLRAGTSVGANMSEGDEASTRPEFARCVAIALRELNETRYWLRLIGRQKWVKPSRLTPLESEAMELCRIFGAMVVRTRARPSR